jgi:hypothetical protein
MRMRHPLYFWYDLGTGEFFARYANDPQAARPRLFMNDYTFGGNGLHGVTVGMDYFQRQLLAWFVSDTSLAYAIQRFQFRDVAGRFSPRAVQNYIQTCIKQGRVNTWVDCTDLDLDWPDFGPATAIQPATPKLTPSKNVVFANLTDDSFLGKSVAGKSNKCQHENAKFVRMALICDKCGIIGGI